jgi:predicted amino acid-binding ACT domain protein
MSNSQLTAVYGIGPDSSGLVGRIAGAIAGSGGNILDLNQSAAHGLFSIFCLVDLGSSGTPIEALRAAVEAVAASSGLTLRVDQVEPSKREAQRKSMLLILVGPDKSGIIASMAQTLGQYGVNIEESRTVAREGLFLMELLTDVSASPLPEPNLRKTITEAMAPRGIRTMFQFEDVFNKKKRVIVFSLARTLADPAVLAEISRQAGVSLDAVSGKVSDEERFDRCAQALEGCPAELLDGIADSFKPTGETAELVRTLKLLGYRVALAPWPPGPSPASPSGSPGRSRPTTPGAWTWK